MNRVRVHACGVNWQHRARGDVVAEVEDYRGGVVDRSGGDVVAELVN